MESVQELASKAQFALEVPAGEAVKASELAEKFASEFASFLKENPTAVLSPIRPSQTQIQMVNYMLDSIDAKSLTLQGTDKEVNPRNGLPMVYKLYAAEDPRVSDVLQSVANLYTDRMVRYHTSWNVRKDFPHSAAIFGSVGITSPGSLRFLFLPGKAESGEQVQDFTGRLKSKDAQGHVAVYKQGERIDFDSKEFYKGKEYSITQQYYLLGSFDGEDTGRTYWAYGSNDEHQSRMTAQEKVGAFEFAKQSSKN